MNMKPKFIKAVLISCAVLMAAGCTVRKTTEIPASNDIDNEIKSEISDETSNDIAGETDGGITEAFEEVLFRGGSFTSVEGETTLSEVYREGTEQEMAEENRSYARVDLDRDGVLEIVLSLAMGDSEYPVGYEVLHYDGEKIVGYYVNYRGLMSLKTDGTFRQSSGARDWGVYSLTSFEMQEYNTHPLMRCESAPMEEGQVGVSYFVEDSEVTESEFCYEVEKWETREDVTFYNLSEFE